MTPETQAIMAKRAQPGHALVPDPPHAGSSALRLTCQRCGRSVLCYQGNIYGSATTEQCKP